MRLFEGIIDPILSNNLMNFFSDRCVQFGKAMDEVVTWRQTIELIGVILASTGNLANPESRPTMDKNMGGPSLGAFCASLKSPHVYSLQLDGSWG